jgi:A nuclease of the HNH/ENDO VII superfamily with conserved WHH
LYGKGGVDGEVEILMTGKDADFTAARDAMRKKLKDNSWPEPSKYSDRPDGYTWHHNENGATMQLVEKTMHDKAISGASHTGGASIVKSTQF